MGFFKDIFGTLWDMKKLAKLQAIVEDAIKELEKEGKLPADLKAVVEKLKTPAEGSEESLHIFKEFIDVLEEHEDLFSADVKKAIEKMDDVEEDLEEIQKDVNKWSKK